MKKDAEPKQFFAAYRIDARFIAAVTANDLEEAKKVAEAEYIAADFGAATDIDGEATFIEDENGNILWEK